MVQGEDSQEKDLRGRVFTKVLEKNPAMKKAETISGVIIL